MLLTSLGRASASRLPAVFGGFLVGQQAARRMLPVDAVVEGPAILEQDDATIFIEPDLRGRVDRFGNVIIERNSS